MRRKNFLVFSMKMHEKYRFFSLYVVQKSQKFFCNGLKNFAIGKKTLLKPTMLIFYKSD